MIKATKLAVFDIDGTIAENGKIPESIIKGFKNLQNSGYKTTIATGRAFWALKNVMGEYFDDIISENTLIVLEHGAKIVDREGNIVFMEEFEQDEIIHVSDFLRANIEIFHEAWFGVPDPNTKLQYWAHDPSSVTKLIKERGQHADIFSCSLGELKKRFLAQPLSNIEVRFRPHVVAQNIKFHLTRTNLDMIMGGGSHGIAGFFRNNVNKGLATRYVANKLNIKMENVLIAANGINDLEMLDLAAGKRILVGPKNERDEILGYLSRTDEVISIDNPAKLGKYLQNL